MTRTDNLRADDSLLLLGRLDGRLHGSPCADIFLARSRLEGATVLAGLAGVPIAVRDLQDWIAGRTPPPRASEGLNDPISVAAVFHLALSRDEDLKDSLGRATLNVLRTVLDDRTEAKVMRPKTWRTSGRCGDSCEPWRTPPSLPVTSSLSPTAFSSCSR